jgi:hypothetical protein
MLHRDLGELVEDYMVLRPRSMTNAQQPHSEADCGLRLRECCASQGP